MLADPSPADSRLAVLQEPVREFAGRTRAVDIRQFEPPTCLRSGQELHELTAQLVAEAGLLVSRIRATCEQLRTADGGSPTPVPEPFLPFEKAIDVAVDSPAEPLSAIEDLAFLVQLELRQRDARLARVRATGAQLANVIGECDSALRCIRKGLTALDVAIARAEHVAPLLDYSSELEDALSIRKAYAKFRRRVLASGSFSEADIHTRMRAAGTTIAVLLGWSAYPRLRVRDRLHLRDLQQRILAWLRPESARDFVEGRRVLEDLGSFVELLKMVNRRQELMAHDAAVLSSLVVHLRERDMPDLDDRSREMLAALEGLDDDLDDAAASAAPRARRVLELCSELGRRLGCDPKVTH